MCDNLFSGISWQVYYNSSCIVAFAKLLVRDSRMIHDDLCTDAISTEVQKLVVYWRKYQLQIPRVTRLSVSYMNYLPIVHDSDTRIRETLVY